MTELHLEGREAARENKGYPIMRAEYFVSSLVLFDFVSKLKPLTGAHVFVGLMNSYEFHASD